MNQSVSSGNNGWFMGAPAGNSSTKPGKSGDV
ncbi:uncharacterized protein METZ01_LOCUS62993, partial [marine metagenome]